MFYPVIFVLFLVTFVSGQTLSPRIVRTKQGSVKGVLVIPSNRDLQPVEAFLGLPFAAPPVGPLRFMPPVTPLPWNGVRLMDKYGPACPQTLPDVSNEKEALRFVTRGRLQYLRRLLPYLRNQSEDCLYLNIYAPVTVGGRDVNIKFPVIVFIHGESFEWNSGNPYDGSILASYGDVIVVTLNFRLGVLGFLRPDLRENRVANFGLLDQIAALQWIQENIGEFSGDRESVTLLGHGTGAVCVNLLLISPVAQASNGLFQRAILMSGTALADWAIVENPLRYTLQAAQQVDCPLAERDDELAACLRFKRVTELMGVRLQAPLYASPLAPLVDGIVVPNEPRQSMKTYNELFGRYDVMYGVTQSESFHLLNAATLQFGLTETERNRIIRTYARNSYASNIDQVTAAILNEYTDWKNPVRDTEEYRDSILEILSDARVVAPVIQMGDLHSAIRQRSYFYVFAHQTSNGDFPQTWGSIHGEELAYVFGMPLVGGTNHLSMNYTRAEMLLSEIVITYWSNFARTGNPNFPPRQKFLTVNTRDRFEPSYVQWPAYDRHSQKYLNIDLRPKVKDHYRADKMALWTKLIPELLANHNGKITSIDDDDDSMTSGTGVPMPSNSPPVMGAQPDFNDPTLGFPLFPFRPKNNTSLTSGSSGDNATEEPGGGIALSIVIVIGICFLVLNVCACAGVFYQRDRVRFKEMLLQRQYKLRPAGLGPAGTPADAVSNREPTESIKGEEESAAALQNDLPHQASTSTMDPHTKVSQWMAQEITIDPCPPPPSGSVSINNKSTSRGLAAAAVVKLGGSDRYDPRESEREPSSILFPMLTKSTKATDIYGLLPLKEEGGAQSQKETAMIEVAPSESTTSTIGRRRKTRSRSQSSLHRRSIAKRDVAVGDDDDGGDQFLDDATGATRNEFSRRESLQNEEDNRLSANYSAPLDTIRRLSYPKVLPDLPRQRQDVDQVYSPSDTDRVVYSIPSTRTAPHSRGSYYRPNQMDATTTTTPSSSILKTNLPQTLVVAPHPRSSILVKSSSSGSSSPPTSVPEPSLVVRPGVSAVAARQAELGQPDLVVRRSSDASGSQQRPPSVRNSRQWYAQYSQSLKSQTSVDQPSDQSSKGDDTRQ